MIFGIIPDALSFTPLMMIRLIDGVSVRGTPGLNTIPPWIFTIYSLTHSLIIAISIVSILFYINNKVGIATGAWIVHILMDIPVHTQDYFPTPFLYPLSDFTINGINSLKLWAVNWVVLILVYNYCYLRNKKRP